MVSSESSKRTSDAYSPALSEAGTRYLHTERGPQCFNDILYEGFYIDYEYVSIELLWAKWILLVSRETVQMMRAGLKPS